MKTLTKATLVAVAAASIGAMSLAPAYAQPFFGGGQQHNVERPGPGGQFPGFRPHGPGGFAGFHGGGGNLIGALLSDRGAEIIDIAAVRLTHQLDLTEDQQALLEDLRTAALDAQAEIRSVRESLLPVSEEQAGEPDLVARYAGVVALTTARAEALEALQPSFEAFIASLDEEQIEKLTPSRPGPAPRR